MMDPRWFDMPEIRRQRYSRSAWIPLRAIHTLETRGKHFRPGWREEFYGLGSVAIPLANAGRAKDLGWNEIGISHEHGPIVGSDGYTPSDVFEWDETLSGIHLALEQRVHGNEPNVWHLNQDLVLALGLVEDAPGSWVCPREGYQEVARLKRNVEGHPVLLEVKAEFLLDYLCARQMGLLLTTFRSRREVVSDPFGLGWEEGHHTEASEGERFERSITPITQDGMPYGASVAVFHVARTDAFPEEDMPDISGIPTDENTAMSSREFRRLGPKYFLVSGELWRNEWIDPAPTSPMVRGDKRNTRCFYRVDHSGQAATSEELAEGGKWIWFRPEVIEDLASRRGGGLRWNTRDIGEVWCSPGWSVTFGVNELGLVTVYAKDIALLPEWQQCIWVARNISPEGGVGRELFRAQGEGFPSDTTAPEVLLASGMERLEAEFRRVWGCSLFQDHRERQRLVAEAHRFRSCNEDGFVGLAKDLARVTADSFLLENLHKIVAPPKQEKWGSLKSLEKVLATRTSPELARSLLTPLVGVFETRHFDAHLPGSDLEEKKAKIGVDPTMPYLHQGLAMIERCADTFHAMAKVLQCQEAAFGDEPNHADQP